MKFIIVSWDSHFPETILLAAVSVNAYMGRIPPTREQVHERASKGYTHKRMRSMEDLYLPLLSAIQSRSDHVYASERYSRGVYPMRCLSSQLKLSQEISHIRASPLGQISRVNGGSMI